MFAAHGAMKPDIGISRVLDRAVNDCARLDFRAMTAIGGFAAMKSGATTSGFGRYLPLIIVSSS